MSTPPATEAPTLVFAELLAGPDHRLAALCWHCTAPQHLLPWLQQPALGELAATLPCVWLADDVALWPEPLRAALPASGQQTEDAEALFSASATDSPDPKTQGSTWPANARWLRGNWYLAPPAKPGSAQAASRQRALQLLQLVADDADTQALEEVFRHDPTLSFQLLRLVNSAGMGSRREITSFGQALLLLGRQPLKRWLNLLLFAARDDDPRGQLLMAHVSLRARGMELLAQAAGHDRDTQDLAFMVGMFSRLDVLFGTPLVDLLHTAHASAALQAALLQRTGPGGELLCAWEAVERADAAATAQALAALAVPAATYNRLLLQACTWMLQLTHTAHDRAP